MKTRGFKSVLLAGALAALCLGSFEGREITGAEMELLKKGEIVKEVVKEEGSQSASWSAKLVDHPPALMWKVICSLELYDDYMERTTVSELLTEEVKDKILKNNLEDAEEIEKLFSGMEKGYKKVLPDGRWVVYSYQRNEFPWPVTDRWVLLEITHDDENMRQSWKRLAGNIKEDFGFWKLSPADGNKTLAINEIHIDLDIPATGPFTAFAMDVTLPDTYENFEKMAVKMAQQ